MKKIIFSIIGLAFLLPETVLGGSCGFQHIEFQGNQDPEDDEFIYENDDAYTAAVLADNRDRGSTDLPGIVWECDREQGCSNNTYVYVPGAHVWNGIPQPTNSIYRCSTVPDKWIRTAYNIDECPDDMDGWSKSTGTIENLPDGAAIYQKGLRVCIQTVDDGAADTTPEDIPEDPPAPTITCVDRCRGMTGQQYNECVACCHVSSSVANWNGNTCICAQNANYLFVPNSDPTTGGQCYMHGQLPEVVVTPEPGYECDPVKIAQIMGWQVQYASNATISGQILAIIQYCDGNPNEITFNTMYNQLLALINQESAAAQLSSQQAASRRRIANAASDIRSVVDNLDVSKWRTAEGNFNTSRLLSDSIAGVVLGTAGGLITSNVMKKNQVSNGLEDIQCTVGGQVVAGWGDQFQVGIH